MTQGYNCEKIDEKAHSDIKISTARGRRGNDAVMNWCKIRADKGLGLGAFKVTEGVNTRQINDNKYFDLPDIFFAKKVLS